MHGVRAHLAVIVLRRASYSLHPYRVQWATAICRDLSSSQTIFPGVEALGSPHWRPESPVVPGYLIAPGDG